MRRILLIGLGWIFVVVGAVLTPMPIPIPMIGVAPLLIGCAILTANSKSFRRGLQHLRHRSGWLSRRFEQFTERGPIAVRAMVRRTRPVVLLRYARMRARHKGA